MRRVGLVPMTSSGSRVCKSDAPTIDPKLDKLHVLNIPPFAGLQPHTIGRGGATQGDCLNELQGRESDERSCVLPTTTWIPSDDRLLLILRRSGLSFAQIGRRLGRTSRSVQSRYYRVEGIVFKSREVHSRKQKIARAQGAEARAAARAAARERLAKSLLDRMARGMARGDAITRAKQEGHSFWRHWSGAGCQSASRTSSHACLEGSERGRVQLAFM